MIEQNILIGLGRKHTEALESAGTHSHNKSLIDKYINTFWKHFSLDNIQHTFLIDCSNGSNSQIAEMALANHSAFRFIYNEPDGKNINLGCGALEPGNLLRFVKRKGYDYGVGFDGDGDRAIFVSKDYGVIETEKVLVLLARYLHEEDKNKTVVSTEICNKGLEKNLNHLNFKLIQTEVGDRFVVNSTIQNKALLGAESSGHFLFPKLSKSMDGLLALYHFIELTEIYGSDLNDELGKLKHYNRISKDIAINTDVHFDIEELSKRINELIDYDSEKMIIRQSMWDPVIRVYYDYKEENNFRKIEETISKYLFRKR